MTAATGAGSTPPASRRRLATWLCVGFGVLLLVAGVIISFLVGSPFSWAGFLIVGGIILFLFAGFVWIRLSD
jgi:multisubunit Na+/H+ antiporter MnhG subunit